LIDKNIEWNKSAELVNYPDATSRMEKRVRAILDKECCEEIWRLEHPSLYTSGLSAKDQDYLNINEFPVYQSGRGGQYTYHGPGQRVVYLMLKLERFKKDLHAYVKFLEEWMIHSLKEFDVKGERRKGRIGIWVVCPDSQERKIAAIGVRVRRWVSFHGIAFNNTVNLDHFKGIIPCGIKAYGVTSLKELGVNVSMTELDDVMQQSFMSLI
jgi:lipoyl(octanoyl) transferase